jgi:hypothetical protein
MRRILGVTALTLCGVLTVLAADSEEAEKTRSERLNVKVTVEWKNTNLSDAMAELASAVKDADKGKLEYKLDTGVSGNQKLNFKGKDKTIAEVLDGALGKDLGYVVVSKKGDKLDGSLLIKSGSERGTAMEGDAKMAAKGKDKADNKTKTKEKPMPKDKAEPKEKPAAPKPMPEEKAEPTADQKEKQAASKLDLIKQLIKDGKRDKARDRLDDLIKGFPDTKAATEAKELLEKMK